MDKQEQVKKQLWLAKMSNRKDCGVESMYTEKCLVFT